MVESYVSYLRRKVDTTEPRLLHTLRGVGYVLRRPAADVPRSTVPAGAADGRAASVAPPAPAPRQRLRAASRCGCGWSRAAVLARGADRHRRRRPATAARLPVEQVDERPARPPPRRPAVDGRARGRVASPRQRSGRSRFYVLSSTAGASASAVQQALPRPDESPPTCRPSTLAEAGGGRTSRSPSASTCGAATGWRVMVDPGGRRRAARCSSATDLERRPTRRRQASLPIELLVGGVVLVLPGRRRLPARARQPAAAGRGRAHGRAPSPPATCPGACPRATTRTEVGRLRRRVQRDARPIEAAFRAREASEARPGGSEDRMRRFVADASHELRTPLTSIRGFAELYRQGAVRDDGELARLMRADRGRGRPDGPARRGPAAARPPGPAAPLSARPVDLRGHGGRRRRRRPAARRRRPLASRSRTSTSRGDGDEAGGRARRRGPAAPGRHQPGDQRPPHTPPTTPVTVRVSTRPAAGPGVPAMGVVEVADEGPGLAPRRGRAGVRALLPRRPARTRARAAPASACRSWPPSSPPTAAGSRSPARPARGPRSGSCCPWMPPPRRRARRPRPPPPGPAPAAARPRLRLRRRSARPSPRRAGGRPGGRRCPRPRRRPHPFPRARTRRLVDCRA